MRPRFETKRKDLISVRLLNHIVAEESSLDFPEDSIIIRIIKTNGSIDSCKVEYHLKRPGRPKPIHVKEYASEMYKGKYMMSPDKTSPVLNNTGFSDIPWASSEGYPLGYTDSRKVGTLYRK